MKKSAINNFWVVGYKWLHDLFFEILSPFAHSSSPYVEPVLSPFEIFFKIAFTLGFPKLHFFLILEHCVEVAATFNIFVVVFRGRWPQWKQPCKVKVIELDFYFYVQFEYGFFVGEYVIFRKIWTGRILVDIQRFAWVL